MKVVWTHQARERLFQVEGFIVTQGPPENAAEFIQTLIGRAKILTDFPNSGRKTPEYDSADVRELIEGNYRIMYRIKAAGTEIETIFEVRRLLPGTDK